MPGCLAVEEENFKQFARVPKFESSKNSLWNHLYCHSDRLREAKEWRNLLKTKGSLDFAPHQSMRSFARDDKLG